MLFGSSTYMPEAKFSKTTPCKVRNRIGRASAPISKTPHRRRQPGDVLAAIARASDVAAALDCN
jgi:hypothetical protein